MSGISRAKAKRRQAGKGVPLDPERARELAKRRWTGQDVAGPAGEIPTPLDRAAPGGPREPFSAVLEGPGALGPEDQDLALMPTSTSSPAGRG